MHQTLHHAWLSNLFLRIFNPPFKAIGGILKNTFSRVSCRGPGMCGILLSTSSNYEKLNYFDRSALDNRGLDSMPIQNFSLEDIEYEAYGSVTPMQRAIPCSRSSDLPDFILLWDGAIYNDLTSVSDAQYIAEKLSACDGSTDAVVRIFGSLHGPFAFVLVKRSEKCIFFGRDKFGRRSLVCNSDLSHLGSLGRSGTDIFVEVPASGIYMASAIPNGGFRVDFWYPWSKDHLQFWSLHPFNMSVKRKFVLDCSELKTPQHLNEREPAYVLMSLLREAVAVRVRLVAPTCQMCFKSSTESSCLHTRVGVLFSGGLDSAVIAALVDRCLAPDQPVDLITVAFQHLQRGTQSSKRRGGCDGEASLLEYASPDSAPDRQTALSSFEELRNSNPNRHWHLVLVDVSVEELKTVRQERVRSLLKPSPETTLNDSLSLALWFAARGSGRLICNQNCLSDLQCSTYRSPARVLLTGMGADEQLAGYSRHRTIFVQQGPRAVEAELAFEMQRIAERNLGRDDRMISDHGREARYPFLDERVVNYLSLLPLESKADLTLRRGEGEKRLLRSVAASLDLPIAARSPKRALQFGSRIAKSESLRKVVGATSTLVSTE
ncbi:Asparagine synthetase domain-containing protein 1 [Taenia crassiceps]|uniref:Asparagine synthetase domain-containing protein 1 n=1 Tax=Taenia crassiceps TaxID=6207 RepID=A0ABR4Q9B2_9CEST